MVELNHRQIRKINQEIDRSGITYSDLQEELLDHLCCDVEAEMDEGIEFITALDNVMKGIGRERMQEIQEETLLLINQKYRIMKKFMYVLGIIAPSLLLIGALLKWQHIPGGGITITLALFLLGAIFIPVYTMVKIRDTRDNKKKVNRSLFITGMITGILFSAAALFKIQHIPGARILLMISTGVALVAFLPAMIKNVIREQENQLQSFLNLVFALTFIGLMFVLISMTVSKEILNSFILAGEGIEETRSLFESKNISQLNAVKNLPDPDESTIADLEELRARTEKLNDYIRSLRIEIAVHSSQDNIDAVDENRNIDLSKLVNIDNPDVSAEIMIGPDRDGKAWELKKRLTEYREYLEGCVGADQKDMISRLLDTSDPPPENLNAGELPLAWADVFFAHLPMISVLNNLARIQCNIVLAENLAIQALLNSEPMLIANYYHIFSSTQ